MHRLVTRIIVFLLALSLMLVTAAIVTGHQLESDVIVAMTDSREIMAEIVDVNRRLNIVVPRPSDTREVLPVGDEVYFSRRSRDFENEVTMIQLNRFTPGNGRFEVIYGYEADSPTDNPITQLPHRVNDLEDFLFFYTADDTYVRYDEATRDTRVIWRNDPDQTGERFVINAIVPSGTQNHILLIGRHMAIMIDIDGNEISRINFDEPVDSAFSQWMPDGIYFLVHILNDRASSIAKLYNSMTGEIHPMTADLHMYDASPVWNCQDANLLMFWQPNEMRSLRLQVLNLDTGEQYEPTAAIDDEIAGGIRTYRPGPACEYVLLVEGGRASIKGDLYRADIRGETAQLVAEDVIAGYPETDGTYFYVREDPPGLYDLYRANLFDPNDTELILEDSPVQSPLVDSRSVTRGYILYMPDSVLFGATGRGQNNAVMYYDIESGEQFPLTTPGRRVLWFYNLP